MRGVSFDRPRKGLKARRSIATFNPVPSATAPSNASASTPLNINGGQVACTPMLINTVVNPAVVNANRSPCARFKVRTVLYTTVTLMAFKANTAPFSKP
jgi:hypothetical protein